MFAARFFSSFIFHPQSIVVCHELKPNMPTSASKRTGPYAPAVLVDLNKDLVVPKAVAEGLATNAWGTFVAGSSGMFLESFGVKVDVVMDQDLEQIVEDDRYSVEVGFAVTKQAARRFDELFSASVKGIEKRIQELDEGGDRKSKVFKALSAWKKAQDLGVQVRWHRHALKGAARCCDDTAPSLQCDDDRFCGLLSACCLVASPASHDDLLRHQRREGHDHQGPSSGHRH